jgi:hypothetical protein
MQERSASFMTLTIAFATVLHSFSRQICLLGTQSSLRIIRDDL